MSGQTPRTVRDAGPVISEQQRAVLGAMAGPQQDVPAPASPPP
ncbi:hypothetical protein [Streptomyces sp. NPDC056600]